MVANQRELSENYSVVRVRIQINLRFQTSGSEGSSLDFNNTKCVDFDFSFHI